jgi:hypothetical protein
VFGRTACRVLGARRCQQGAEALASQNELHARNLKSHLCRKRDLAWSPDLLHRLPGHWLRSGSASFRRAVQSELVKAVRRISGSESFVMNVALPLRDTQGR